MPHHISLDSDYSPSDQESQNHTTSTSQTTTLDSLSKLSSGSSHQDSARYIDHSTTSHRSKGANQLHNQITSVDHFEEYFIQQAKLFNHLEKRYNKFQKKQKEEQARARNNRLNKKNHPASSPRKDNKKRDRQPISVAPATNNHSSQSSTTSTEIDNMIGNSVSALRGQVGRSFAQATRPAISITRASTPIASFSSSPSSSVRNQKLTTKKKKKFVNPDAMTAEEASRVLRALEIANPTSSYSLTLSTKSTKSSLPIRGHFHLPLDPRRSSETILVFTEPNSPSSNLAKQAGAAYVGGEELFESVLSGKISPTRCLATPGMMPQVTRNLARYLGPKGLMPVAKRGLVGEGEELAEKIRDAAGRMEYRADKEGLVRIPVARMDFEIPSIENNIRSFIQTVRDNQSAGTSDDAVTAAAKKKKKGSSITAVRLETTNGPSIEINDVL
ncbi:uncharacterized protein L201_007371 [Kwoniella dendrophila CBS 6074]|uniref:Ribosomal protein n=1 Tax=Kwoniella dendrophila CBS 6074 TaxID=1295534 RepID=A0AAX4K4U8_9TREE